MKLVQILEDVSQEMMQKFQQWQKACRAESPNCQFSGSVGSAQAGDWMAGRVIGDWDGKTGKGVIYKADDAVGTRAARFIEKKYFVWDEVAVRPDRYICIIEEEKTRYKITVTERGVWVEPDQDTGGTPEGAQQIEQEIKAFLAQK